MSFLGGRFFGGRFLGGRFFGGSSGILLPVEPFIARPVFAWPWYSDNLGSVVPVLSGGNWVGSLPLSNLQNRHLSRVARSTSTVSAHTRCDVDLRTPRPVGFCALVKHNMTLAGRVRWTFAATSDFASPLYVSALLPVRPSGATDEDLDGLNKTHTHILSAPVSARYVRCEMFDTANTAGYIEIARLAVAGAYRAPHGVNLGAKIGLETATERIVSDGGAALYAAKAVRRTYDFSLSMLDDPQAFAMLWTMQRQLGTHRQLIIAFGENDPYWHDRTFLGVLRELSGIESPFSLYNATTFRIVEEL